MVARGNAAPVETRRIKVADVRRRIAVYREFQHLIEVAIVESAIPAYGEGIPAHDAGGGGGVIGRGKPFHVTIVVPAFQQKFEKPAHGHVGDGVETVEFHAVPGAKFLPELGLNRILSWREKGPHRIMDEIEYQAGSFASITELVQTAKRFDGFIEDAFPALGIGLSCPVVGEGCDDLHPMGGKKFGEVRLRGNQQHREIAAIHDVATEGTGLLDEPSKIED
jgi:hypothetical protein